jgi:hypothetical protein
MRDVLDSFLDLVDQTEDLEIIDLDDEPPPGKRPYVSVILKNKIFKKLPDGRWSARPTAREWLLGYLTKSGEVLKTEVLAAAKRAGYNPPSVASAFTGVGGVTTTKNRAKYWALVGQPVAGSVRRPVAELILEYLKERDEELPADVVIKDVSERHGLSAEFVRQSLYKVPGVHRRTILGEPHVSLATSRRDPPPANVYKAREVKEPRPQVNLQILEWLRSILAERGSIPGKVLFAEAKKLGWTEVQVRPVSRQHSDIIKITYDQEDGSSKWALR